MKTEHFCFLLLEEFTHIAFACAVEPLRLANLLTDQELYSWSFVSRNGEDATCSNGSVIKTHHDLNHIPPCEWLFIVSGTHVQKYTDRDLLASIRRERAKGRRIGALCTGAYVLAAAGFLDGCKTAVHWELHDGFMEAFPEVNLVRSVFVADEPFVSASGGAAATDLILHFIEETHGRELAMAIADQMIFGVVRDSSVEQRVPLQSRQGIRNPSLISAIKLMEQRLEEPVSPAGIAREIGISPRQLERLFGRYLNCSPKKYYVDLRLQRARNLLVQTEISVREAGVACGFDDVKHFTRVYRAKFGVSPKQQRSKLN